MTAPFRCRSSDGDGIAADTILGHATRRRKPAGSPLGPAATDTCETQSSRFSSFSRQLPSRRAAAPAGDRGPGDDRPRPRAARRRLRLSAVGVLSGVGPRRQPAAGADTRRQLRHQLDRRAADRRWSVQPAVRQLASGRAAVGPARLHRRPHAATSKTSSSPRRSASLRRSQVGRPSACASRRGCRMRATRAGSGSTRPTSMLRC